MGEEMDAKITEPNMCFTDFQNQKETLIMQLRLMMRNAKPDDKCTLCKAIETLEKESTQNFSSMWMALIMMLLIPGFADDKTIRTVVDILKKQNEEKESS